MPAVEEQPAVELAELCVDTGQLRLIQPYVPDTAPANVVTGSRTMWGWSSVAPTGPPPSNPSPLPG